MKNKKWFFLFMTMLGFLAFTTSCEDEDDSEHLPKLVTNEVTNINTGTATCSAHIISQGSSEITEKGVCWSTGPEPTVSDNLLYAGDGSDDYLCDITGLTANVTYYARAYATNNSGTAYGNVISFTTLDNYPVPAPCNPDVNSIYFNSQKLSFFIVDAGSSETNFGSYCLMGSELSGTLYIEFSVVPNSGKFITTTVNSTLGAGQCIVDGRFGSLGWLFIAAAGDTVYVTKTGNGKYSMSFCDLEFSSGSTSYTFVSDGNLTSE